MGGIIRKEHNVSALTCHIACPVKCRRAVINKEVDEKLWEMRLGIEARCETKFLEIGSEQDRARSPAQSGLAYGPEKMVRTIKSVTARKIFEECPEVKKMLWGGEFWTRGCYAGTAGGMGMGG
ncbi:MAG: IS200/IS605 family transposase [Treponema sp.]|jgi:REP element-mobilizing transposase RayT|nr:IS200/IS605 family transposase [Treponema sp.]